MFDGIYDEPVRDEALQMGFNPTAQEGRYTLILDARKYDEWIYLDLHRLAIERHPIPATLTGEWDGRSVWARYNVQGSRYTLLEERQVDTQAEPEQWDLALHHFDVRTNGGLFETKICLCVFIGDTLYDSFQSRIVLRVLTVFNPFTD